MMKGTGKLLNIPIQLLKQQVEDEVCNALHIQITIRLQANLNQQFLTDKEKCMCSVWRAIWKETTPTGRAKIEEGNNQSTRDSRYSSRLYGIVDGEIPAEELLGSVERRRSQQDPATLGQVVGQDRVPSRS